MNVCLPNGMNRNGEIDRNQIRLRLEGATRTTNWERKFMQNLLESKVDKYETSGLTID